LVESETDLKAQSPTCGRPFPPAMIIEIVNESELAFQLDGDWLKAGEFKSDKSALVAPNSETVVEITPSTVHD